MIGIDIQTRNSNTGTCSCLNQCSKSYRRSTLTGLEEHWSYCGKKNGGHWGSRKYVLSHLKRKPTPQKHALDWLDYSPMLFRVANVLGNIEFRMGTLWSSWAGAAHTTFQVRYPLMRKTKRKEQKAMQGANTGEHRRPINYQPPTHWWITTRHLDLSGCQDAETRHRPTNLATSARIDRRDKQAANRSGSRDARLKQILLFLVKATGPYEYEMNFFGAWPSDEALWLMWQ
jgi:hypothetical protein